MKTHTERTQRLLLMDHISENIGQLITMITVEGDQQKEGDFMKGVGVFLRSPPTMLMSMSITVVEMKWPRIARI